MPKKTFLLNTKSTMPEWMTIQEAVRITKKIKKIKLTDSDIYRHALYGDINLSIYFQSPIVLRKIRTLDNKLKLRPVGHVFINQLCLLDRNSFLSKRELILSTEGRYITPTQPIIDTPLAGYEYVMVQCLLAHSLHIPLPNTGTNEINYGISVTLSGEIFQVFEKLTWQERINKQIMRLPKDMSPDIHEITLQQNMNPDRRKDYFPIHDLPQDACFVIRHTELEKLINMLTKNKAPSLSSTRISTPLSRLFWLACKHNEAISPLIRQPYKLLSIFEQWASTDGITDHLSGDTLKTALERGSPTSISTSN
ncbi:hypothetical protein Dpoa2040_003150 [Dickeya sp. CFBP 2040]|uniref:hypothetical protein n=1 Tax=Dickeya sp. CFBP 2040 TaxID=2718531 RepID=UPI001446963A|nr:hypothetical protein [Dickeya sp. CFBP 2040]NKI75828.1 hypothetical protein [Dickeya sp. CFBP 2040]